MAISHYKIYIDSCIDFVHTFVIKSEQLAKVIFELDELELMKRQLTGDPLFELNKYDKSTWRYYMHLAGMLHETDYVYTRNSSGEVIGKRPKIYVRSMDTGEDIPFTKESFKVHRATAREYKIGTTYYQNLIDKYPNDIDYIRGVLNPVDLDVAVNAPNNKLLNWDDSYREANEHSLMENIQDYIDAYFHRWDNEDFGIVDNLYHQARLGILYNTLPHAIVSIRFKKAKTNEAHSFHVWSYLGSHHRLDYFRGYLNLRQRMWFYRNSEYVEHNPGKSETFDDLIDIVMTERDLPISEFESKQKYDEWYPDEEGNTSDSLYPDNEWERLPYNFKDKLWNEDKIVKTDELVDKEFGESPENPRYNYGDKIETNDLINKSLINNLPSKVLESVARDLSKAKPINIQDVEFNTWLYMTTNNMYHAKIVVVNPLTNVTYSLNQKDALILYVYCCLKTYGCIPEISTRKHLIPTIIAYDVLKINRPKFEHTLNLIDQRITHPIYAYALNEYTPFARNIFSVQDFVDYCKEVYDTKVTHRDIYSFTNDARTHIQIKQLSHQYFEDVVCLLTEEPTYFEDYFKTIGVDVENLTLLHYNLLANNITTQVFGKNLVNSISLNKLQEMMIKLLTRLSSYSVQFLRKINEDEVTVVDWPYLRYNWYPGEKGYLQSNLRLTHIKAYNLTNKGFHKYSEPLFKSTTRKDNSYNRGFAKSSIDLIMELIPKGNGICFTYSRMPTVQFTSLGITYTQPKPKETTVEDLWNLDDFHIHKTTEDRSIVEVDKEDGTLIVRGVVYMKNKS